MRRSPCDWDRLVYVHNAPVPSKAANAVQVTKMCAAFQDAGIDTTLVVPAGMAGTADEMRSRYRLGRNINLQTAACPRVPARELIFGALAGFRFGRQPRTLFYTRSISVAYAVAATRHAVALELHGPMLGIRPSLRRRLFALAKSRQLRQLVVICDALRRHYERTLPELAGRICVAHDAAEPISGDSEPAPMAGEFKVGYVGHLYPGKGMELIAAVAPLCPDMTFHVVGGLRKDVDHWRTRLASQSNVVFHGYVAYSEAASFIAGMDVVVAPYLRVVRGVGMGDSNLADWMSPLKLFEYMAAGKAIVTSDLPVLKEVVAHGEEALLCDPDHPQDWADVLMSLRSRPQWRVELGARALKKFLELYSWDQRAHRVLARLRVSD